MPTITRSSDTLSMWTNAARRVVVYFKDIVHREDTDMRPQVQSTAV